MSGLEKIIETIDNSFAQSCDGTVEQARNEAEKIVSNAKKQAEQRRQQALDLGRAQSERQYNMIVSSLLAEQKRKLLFAKNRAVEEVVSRAVKSFEKLSDKEYFDVLISLLQKYRRNENCRLLMSKADVQRLDSESEQRLKNGAGEYKIEIVGDDGITGGGFVLDYGEICENCTFPALLQDNIDAVKDAVTAMLFEGTV